MMCESCVKRTLCHELAIATIKALRPNQAVRACRMVLLVSLLRASVDLEQAYLSLKKLAAQYNPVSP